MAFASSLLVVAVMLIVAMAEVMLMVGMVIEVVLVLTVMVIVIMVVVPLEERTRIVCPIHRSEKRVRKAKGSTEIQKTFPGCPQRYIQKRPCRVITTLSP